MYMNHDGGGLVRATCHWAPPDKALSQSPPLMLKIFNSWCRRHVVCLFARPPCLLLLSTEQHTDSEIEKSLSVKWGMRIWGSRGDRTEQPAAAGVVGGGSLELRSFAGGAGDRSMMISPIMLRFRPIAPKPALGDPFSGASQAEGPGGAATWRRVKRKYRVRVRRKNIRRGNSSRSDVAGGGTGSGEACKAATMRLLSAKEEGQAPAAAGSDGHRQDLQTGSKEIRGALKVGGGAVGAPDRQVVESRVTVESVGGAYMGAGDSLGLTDVERLRSLELDPCPAFVTDALNRVRWLNAAYLWLVAGGEGEGADVRVQVAAKEELPRLSEAFTCQVRVEHTWRDKRYSELVPCDVWRLDWGEFAWRLDVKAALSLGF